jgi:hypothetical protein
MKVRLTVPVATRPAPIPAYGIPPTLTRPPVTPAALLRVGRAAAGAALLAVAVAACTGGGSPSSVPSILTPSPHVTTSTASGGAGRTPSPSSGGTGKSSATDKPTSSAKATSTGTATPTARATATATPTHRPSATTSATAKATPRVTHHATTAPTHHYPVGAPQTGGGGTAGLQDVTLFGAGGAAILAGFASLAYRRRLTRKRRAEADTRPAVPTHTTVH